MIEIISLILELISAILGFGLFIISGILTIPIAVFILFVLYNAFSDNTFSDNLREK
jgi:hypothetical protein